MTALGDDPASEAVRRELKGRVRLVELPLDGTLPVKTRVMASGRPLVRIDRGGGTPGEPHRACATRWPRPTPSSSPTTAGTRQSAVREHLAAVTPRIPLVWDPHPKGDTPVPGARLVTPNAAETRALCPGDGETLRSYAERGAELADRWRAAGVAVTLGERGVLLTRPGSGTPMLIPSPYHATGDPCGAGDCFAATTAAALADGSLPEEALQRAVAEAAAFVSAGGATNPALVADDGRLRARRRRRAPTRSPSRNGCGPAAARWWPPAAASTCCTPATSASWRAPGASADC